MKDNFDYDELWCALKEIQSVCEEAQDCKKCPFGNQHGNCLVMAEQPVGWKIVNPNNLIRMLL